MLIAIAWRNLWRNKLRSAVIFSSIAVGIIGAVFSDGFMSGMTDQRVNSAIANEVADIQIHQPAFLLNGEIRYQIPRAQRIAPKISTLPEVKGVSLRMKTQAMAASANAGTGINLYGVNPADERKTSDLHTHIIEGKYLSEKQKIPVVIGQKLSRKLDLGIGDKLIVTLTDSSGTITNSAFQITGIYKTANDRFDAASVFVNKKDLAKVIGYPASSGDEIAIRLKNSRNTPAVMKKLNRIFRKEVQKKQIILQSWDQIQPMLKSMVSMMDFFSYLFLLIILAALAFAIINTMLMAVMERTREIAGIFGRHTQQFQLRPHDGRFLSLLRRRTAERLRMDGFNLFAGQRHLLLALHQHRPALHEVDTEKAGTHRGPATHQLGH